MLIYILLLAIFFVGQLLYSCKKMSKKIYCSISCFALVMISGLRNVNVGMWDTASVYIPSFKVINENRIIDLLKLENTQYKFIGYVIYSKLVGMISQNEQFYVFMMACPFFIIICYLIYKHSDIPLNSFLALVAIGYLTYSFSMIRGMLAFAALGIAFDAAIEDKWKKFLVWVGIAATFHITAILFLTVYFIKKTRWTIKRLAIVFIAIIFGQRFFPVIWQWFVRKFISRWLMTYNYYATKGGELADALLLVYLIMCLVAVMKLLLTKKKYRKGWKYLNSQGREKDYNLEYRKDIISYNLYLGMATWATVIIVFTSVLSEMIRIAMVLGIGSVLLAGKRLIGFESRNTMFICIGELLQLVIFVAYFIMAALPNMNAIPYKFFWQ